MKLSAINFITTYRVEIAGIFLILGIINYVSYVIYDKLAKRKFMILCSLFVEKFGAKPAEVLIYQDGGFFFSFMRDAFFIKALYFKENSFHTRGMNNEQIRFIKELPNQYTNWLRVKVRLSIVGIILLFMMLSVFYLSAFI
ncbi:hypothetical protein [Shimwellia blattae]|uniref:Putative membrane protein n=1 Tax=Shimwellia blattae (strain ATCC 29907 / DSM 4481 / JCM 1650 / NBRC 105725 / CDC 9005-74) TaxID=630626 RepID=I2B7M4_SHIBC|nr:hypothetical protein [Shimwellia blattae]AFJ46528.1 putative membrane protein [Shimwellia blattae DSM 4481 = NBRC 105725]GAB80108.1 hypothetical protein EB105725_04_02190 [Shimwellia blattae DSM 4481 = NBRC 105725]VDY63996.1 Uncharacterised protein [Shimwellia blattae]VEC22131.1 Uncharacterised protein [Shimwellia blattae]